MQQIVVDRPLHYHHGLQQTKLYNKHQTQYQHQRHPSRHQSKFVNLIYLQMSPFIQTVIKHWLLWFLSALIVNSAVAGNPDAKRLYDDLLSNYNKLVRPVVNTSDVLRVCIKLKLSQLIDVVSKAWTIILFC